MLPEHLVTNGLYLARYNETTDTTVAMASCDHSYCDHAIRLRGDARPVDIQDLVLKGPRRLVVEPLEPPLVLPDGKNVTTVVAGTFEVRPLSWDIWYVAGLVGALTFAVAVAAASRWPVAATAGLLAVPSAWLGAQIGDLISSGIVPWLGLGAFLLWLLTAIAIGLRGRWQTAPGPVAMGTLAAGVVGAVVFWESFAPSFPI